MDNIVSNAIDAMAAIALFLIILAFVIGIFFGIRNKQE